MTQWHYIYLHMVSVVLLLFANTLASHKPHQQKGLTNTQQAKLYHVLPLTGQSFCVNTAHLSSAQARLFLRAVHEAGAFWEKELLYPGLFKFLPCSLQSTKRVEQSVISFQSARKWPNNIHKRQFAYTIKSKALHGKTGHMNIFLKKQRCWLQAGKRLFEAGEHGLYKMSDKHCVHLAVALAHELGHALLFQHPDTLACQKFSGKANRKQCLEFAHCVWRFDGARCLGAPKIHHDCLARSPAPIMCQWYCHRPLAEWKAYVAD